MTRVTVSWFLYAIFMLGAGTVNLFTPFKQDGYVIILLGALLALYLMYKGRSHGR